MLVMPEKRRPLGRRWAFAVFFSIMLLHVVSILLFTRGFLLTRTELSQYSQCPDIAESPCVPPPPPKTDPENDENCHGNGTSSCGACWSEPAVDRVVIIILDALRFDFVAPSTLFGEKRPWMDKLSVLHKLATSRKSSAKLFKAIADPPTTTLQRLKGLTTGGLPTFIDIGNNFGAPAIVEDNLVYQLARNGKRVLMMGDDTWVQLFPHHFSKSYPFPSFNVKDLHTVDNGCINNLLPSLYQEDWDVLIAHFLGMDHAGHIHGVDSLPMMEKLEQYNLMLEKVVEVLENLSGSGGIHENTLLLVMGDHGQTLNGDHGGGSAEEVETAIFALSLKEPPTSLPSKFDGSTCMLGTDEQDFCISIMHQLDFSATVSALLGVPFPFGSVGRVNPELYAVAAGTWRKFAGTTNVSSQSAFEDWIKNYANILCINSWQVKRYIDVYSTSSSIGFSGKDLSHLSDLYADTLDIWSSSTKSSLLCDHRGCFTSPSAVKMQLDAYSKFLATVAGLARSKWTEFNLRIMGIGFCLMVLSLLVHFCIIFYLENLYKHHLPLPSNLGLPYIAIFAYAVVLLRGASFLSNSFILEEGKVASFLWASTAMLQLRYAIVSKKVLVEAIVFVLLVPVLRFGIVLGQFKQAVNSMFLKIDSSWILGVQGELHLFTFLAEIVPQICLSMVAYFIYRCTASLLSKGPLKYTILGTIFNYVLIILYWASDSGKTSLPSMIKGLERNVLPRVIYVVSFLQLLLLAVFEIFIQEGRFEWEGNTGTKVLAMLSSWSSPIIILSGKQGPLVALASIVAGWCIIKLMRLRQDSCDRHTETASFYSFPVIQWSLLAASLFFCTGHWCAFDGLRYAAAFIGFDEFNLIRQAILLTIETYGFSLILPIIALPSLVVCLQTRQPVHRVAISSLQICQVYLIYGVVMAVSVTFSMLCVTIQRRHLMVWGLFAPKFVFDVVGLILCDLLTCFASLYYFV